MSLAVSNIRLLTLTARKADCEYNISIDAMEKMALTREQSELSAEYYAKLHGKNITYYANGQYNQMDYGYLMGYSCSTFDKMKSNPGMLKKDYSMILTDYNGRVVMNSSLAKTMQKVLGSSCIDADGRGGTFSQDKIPALIADIAGPPCSADNVKTIIDGGIDSHEYSVTTLKTMSQDVVSTGTSHDASGTWSSAIEQLVNFYYPIFQAAAFNGWTTEYNKEMEGGNSNYISDALVSGIFQLEQVYDSGNYKPDSSLTYFTTTGLVVERTDSSVREDITAWYNAEKEKISEKESWLDLEIQDLSTELEAIKTEIESVKSFIEDDMSVFEWGTG